MSASPTEMDSESSIGNESYLELVDIQRIAIIHNYFCQQPSLKKAEHYPIEA